MTLIETQNFKTFEEYLLSLKKSARKNYRHANKSFPFKYKKMDFDRDRVEGFMELWGRQFVRGNPIQWAFPVGTVEDWNRKGELMYFELAGIAGHFIQKRENYLECHPPMYDKQFKYLGTLMWFNLIKYAIENNLGILNLGGGDDYSWRARIKHRADHINSRYKWRFVPEEVKNNPDKQVDYKLMNYKLHDGV